MKILWLSEIGLEGKVERTFPIMRTEFAWFCASDGHHTNVGKLPNIPDNSYDIAIVILPKKEEILYQLSTHNKFDLIGHMKRVAKKIGWMQEGPVKYFHDYSVAIQTWFFSTLTKMDFLMVHNENDKQYLRAHISDLDIFVNRTLMIEDSIKDVNEKNELYLPTDVIIGGNFVGWYGGFDSYVVALEFGTKIVAPSMGRMPKDEYGIDGLKHLPYMSWVEWINKLAEFRYAVHLMPTAAAGTFALNCAYLGIPCIGNENIDTQHWCHEHLSVDVNCGLGNAKEIAKKLKEDNEFYGFCSSESKRMYKEMFSEEVWKKNFFDFLEKVSN
jgi:hypothetical protein